ncbi:LGFP repeat-containing protein, partial [Microbacterium ginsengisoli]|uniref:LGFP repeat-containing protein n=1 Tax=Microbacterium ginsengisoli TaxID=400772 RepID=UPI003A5BEC24
SFVGGALVGTTSAGIVPVIGQYRDVWMAAGGPTGSLGLPMGVDSCNGMNCSQVFQGGVLVWTPTYGVASVSSWFLAPWQAQGSGAGALGAPTGNSTCSSVTCMQSFVGGALVGTTSAGIVPVIGQYRDVWMAAGGPTGSLGLPMGVDSCNGMNCSQVFQGGVLVWTPTYGVASVSSWFLAPWQAQGSGAGALGAPTGNSTCSSVTCMQSFVGGALVGTTSAGIVPVLGAYRDIWVASGGVTGALGLPTGVTQCNGRWCAAPFAGGSILWSPATGAYAVSGAVNIAWVGAGGAAGTYGLPIAAATTSNGKVSQRFQFGVISVNG